MSDLDKLARLLRERDRLHEKYLNSITDSSLLVSDEWAVFIQAAEKFDRALEAFGGIPALLAGLRQAERVLVIDDVLEAQVRATLTVLKAGGDIRRANLDDRLMTDRLQDTLDARVKARK